jgi:putative FmdB family regulatory protein
MPTYEYRCAKCSRKFQLLMSIAEHGKRRPKCPKCGSARVTQLLSAFYAQTAKKS